MKQSGYIQHPKAHMWQFLDLLFHTQVMFPLFMGSKIFRLGHPRQYLSHTTFILSDVTHITRASAFSLVFSFHCYRVSQKKPIFSKNLMSFVRFSCSLTLNGGSWGQEIDWCWWHVPYRWQKMRQTHILSIKEQLEIPVT